MSSVEQGHVVPSHVSSYPKSQKISIYESSMEQERSSSFQNLKYDYVSISKHCRGRWVMRPHPMSNLIISNLTKSPLPSHLWGLVLGVVYHCKFLVRYPFLSLLWNFPFGITDLVKDVSSFWLTVSLAN